MPRKRRGPGRCTYCLRHVDSLTDEHVVARSWYVAALPDVPKPQVPVCSECNNRLSRPENHLRERFVLAYAAGDERVAGVQENALRGIDPTSATDPREQRIRGGRRDLIAREARELRATIAEAALGVGLVPGFGAHDQPDPATWLPLRIDQADLRAVAEKIVRGMVFYTSRRLIEPPYEVRVELLTAAAREKLLAQIANSDGAFTIALGEGFRFSAAPIPDDPLAVVCDIHLWSRLNISAAVVPESS